MFKINLMTNLFAERINKDLLIYKNTQYFHPKVKSNIIKN